MPSPPAAAPLALRTQRRLSALITAARTALGTTALRSPHPEASGSILQRPLPLPPRLPSARRPERQPQPQHAHSWTIDRTIHIQTRGSSCRAATGRLEVRSFGSRSGAPPHLRCPDPTFQPSACRGSDGEWCNGSTTDSDSVCLGSNPGSPASYRLLTKPQQFEDVSKMARRCNHLAQPPSSSSCVVRGVSVSGREWGALVSSSSRSRRIT